MFSPYSALLRYRKAIQAALPALVALDAAHNIYSLHQLAKARREELEEEERQDLMATTTRTLARILSRCQAEDADFWPAAISARTGVAAAARAAPEVAAAAADPFQQILTTDPGNSLANSEEDAAMPACEVLEIGGAGGLHYEAALQSRDASQINPSSQGVAVTFVTMGCALGHVSQALCCLSASAAAHCMRSGFVVGLEARCRGLALRTLAAVDDTREQCRGAMPWPQAALVRRSALRCCVEWRGLSWPIRPCAAPCLELHLTIP